MYGGRNSRLRLTMIHMSKRKCSSRGVQHSGHVLSGSAKHNIEIALGFSIKKCRLPIPPRRDLLSMRACAFHGQLHRTARPLLTFLTRGTLDVGSVVARRCRLHCRGPHPPILSPGATQQLVNGCTAVRRGHTAARPLASPRATQWH
jgi:hypothetical protein